MGYIADNLHEIKNNIPSHVTLIAVTKTYPVEVVLEAYNSGHTVFGENKVQELLTKNNELPQDVRWHLIGHLQSNKVKYIAPFIHLIHAVDSFKLLEEINKQAKKNGRVIDCLLQVHIAKEETKFGLDYKEVESLLMMNELGNLKNIKLVGLMGMATNTTDVGQIRSEFKGLYSFYSSAKKMEIENCKFTTLSMGMSSDYKIAIDEGSNMVRIGSAIFGKRV